MDNVGLDDHATVGYDGYWQRAQVSPGESLMKPLSPHPTPQEFLILQKSAVTPTRRTPWLMFFWHPFKIPLLYDDQTEASTATEMGLWARALANSVHPSTSTYPVIENSPPFFLQA